MLITTKQRRKNLNNDQLDIKIGGDSLVQVDHEKLLGVTVDHHLDWKEHVNRVYKKVSMNLALFRRIKKYLPVWSRVTFYNSYVLPHIDYCITVWGSSSDITRLTKLQKQAARIILDSDISVSSKDLFNKLRWMPIPDWIKFRKVFTVYKALNGLHPQYITDMFKTVGNIHTRCTRQSFNNDLYLPPGAKLNIFRNSLCYSGAQLYNSLPADIKNAPSAMSFKHRYFKMYFNS